jgi:hypothetical protein
VSRTYSSNSRYGEIKKLAKEAGVKVCALLAMSEKRDPFYCGAPADVRDAEWFAEQWERFDGRRGHIRRLHYRMLEQGVIRPDKPVPYINDKPSWLFLLQAAPRARHLGLVDPLEVVDKRNEPVRIYSPRRDVEPRPDVVRKPDLWIAPEIEGSNFDTPLIEAPTLKGYDYSPADQPVQVEIWVEKSGR